MDEKEKGGERTSWHAVDDSSITLSPPSGGRSEALSAHPLSLLLSPSHVLGSSRLLCNRARRGVKGGKRSMVRDGLDLVGIIIGGAV